MRSASFGAQWVCLLFIAILMDFCPSVFAVPAPRKFVQVTQPDGSKLTILQKGDEFFHYAVSSDGYTLRTDSSGFYRYTVRDNKGDLVPGPHIAADPASRNAESLRFLSTIKPGMRFSEQQHATGIQQRMERSILPVRRAPAKIGQAASMGNLLINDYPLTGKVRSLVILVSFKDNNFTTPTPDSAFYQSLNKKGYNVGSHIGSVKDYYTFNSGGIFTPEFVVAGPVKLSNTMKYYGANTGGGGTDAHPRDMVMEACKAVNGTVDFSQFDNNGDGVVDNVYIFYAGMGEADGGGENSIWPHSYSLDKSGSYSLTLDGKTILTYGCSAELDGEGNMTGIGVFTHEFGHVLGLPDFYDSDGSDNGEGFDLDGWSLMAYGSYNKSGQVPPCLTLIERYLLGWAEPALLSEPTSPSLPPWVSSNQGLMIPTTNNKEFFLLENRQQLKGTWDEFIPHHGMLVYHIDARDDASTSVTVGTNKKTYSYEQLWQQNLVNAISNHQCADIVEADNSALAYNGLNYTAYINSMKGDPFPGTSSNTSITDKTEPSLKTWDGAAVNKPITGIKEKTGGAVTFDFMRTPEIPLVQHANQVYPFSFEAKWRSAERATGYLIDVFTLDFSGGDSIKTYVPGYNGYLVTDTSCIIHVPSEQSTYYYQVRSTNGFTESKSSEIISLFTTNSKPVIRPAGDIRPFQFKANWESLPWATGYYLTVYEIDSLPGGETVQTIIPRYNNYFTPDTSFLVDELDHEQTYGYFIAATDGFATGVQSDSVALTTLPATAITYFVRDDYIHLKGIDPGSTIIVYGLDGNVRQTTREPIIKVAEKGLYIVDVQFKRARKRIKVLVN